MLIKEIEKKINYCRPDITSVIYNMYGDSEFTWANIVDDSGIILLMSILNFYPEIIEKDVLNDFTLWIYDWVNNHINENDIDLLDTLDAVITYSNNKTEKNLYSAKQVVKDNTTKVNMANVLLVSLEKFLEDDVAEALLVIFDYMVNNETFVMSAENWMMRKSIVVATDE